MTDAERQWTARYLLQWELEHPSGTAPDAPKTAPAVADRHAFAVRDSINSECGKNTDSPVDVIKIRAFSRLYYLDHYDELKP